ncbi:MAG: protease complex subunit PrcB family protein [Undibacterium sp.]|nr:protease complex subunit PrcB family protein [Undibacterium sp.]
MNKFLIPCLLLATVISGCGGGGKLADTPITPIAPSIATADFIALASGASCANLRNRLFVIDQKQVFWDKAGSCADAAYSQVLYGNTPQNMICSSADTIAGPKTSCTDEQYRSMFDTISKNLDKADLGLGSGHTVQKLSVPSGVSSAIPFVSIAAPLYYGAAPTNIVIKDAAAWSKLLDDGQLKKDASGASLSVDFSTQMVLGVFFKSANNCSVTQILKLSANGQKLIAEFSDEERISVQSCDSVSNLASTPMNLVVINRIELPVEFVNVNATKVAFNTLNVTTGSGVQAAQNVLIKDGTAWTALWAQHTNNSGVILPGVDFSKRMVVAIFLGSKPSGCYAIADASVWRSGAKLHVAHHDRVPGSAELCTMSITTPAYLIELDRTDDPVEFTAIPLAH